MIEYRIIRNRRDADVKSLGAISALSNEAPQSLRGDIEHFTGELNHLNLAETLLIGAYVGAELVGFCRFLLSSKLKLWWCRGLEVVPEWQRRGIGTALLVTALDHLHAGGAETVRSDTSSRNHASQATHIKAGFVLIASSGEGFDGKWRDDHCYYQWDAQPTE